MLCSGEYELDLSNSRADDSQKGMKAWVKAFRNTNLITGGRNPRIRFQLSLPEKFASQRGRASMDVNGNDVSAALPSIVYRFISDFGSKDSVRLNKFKCPWCYLDCQHVDALMKHLKLCHDRLIFKVKTTDDVHIVSVELSLENIQDHQSYRRRIRKNADKSDYFFHRPRADRQIQTMNTLDAETVQCASNVRYIIYKSSTNLPVSHSDEFENDSEGDVDPEWVQDYNERLMDEFTDVNEGEKDFMKLWNRHISSYSFKSDKSRPDICRQFIELYGRTVLERNLYRNCLLHFCNLHEFEILTAAHVNQLVLELQAKMYDLPVPHSTKK